MTPLDDELRSLLHARADELSPAPDPLSGIERRAKRMRRNRVAASVAGSALIVAGIAVAVPSLVTDHDGAAGHVATSTAPSPSATATYSANELDPTHPWEYRGDPSVLTGGNVETLRREWEIKHPNTLINTLYGQVYAPSHQAEVVFVSHSVNGGDNRWGVATTSESGIEFLVDQALPTPATALMAVLPGDQAPRLLVLAGPATGELSYAKDGTSFQTIPGPTVGVAFIPLEGDTSHDAVRVLDGNGDIDHPVFEGPAPDAPVTSSAAPVTSPTVKPSNYVAWQTRGTVDARLEDQAVSAYAQAKATTNDKVGHHVLWGGTDKAGRQLLFMEAWVAGGQAQTFGMVSTGERFLGPTLTTDPPLLAYLAAGAPGTGTDVLVLLPRLGAGPFSYASSATAAYQNVGNARSNLQNVAVIARDPKATTDRVKVYEGDAMHVLYDGPVQPLLCGASGCG